MSPPTGVLLNSSHREEAIALLDRDPVQNVILIDSIRNGKPDRRSPSPPVYAVVRDGRITSLEMIDNNLIFYAPDPEDIPLLAEHASSRSEWIYSVFGSREPVRTFLRHFRIPGKKIRLVRDRQRVYTLTRETFLPQPAGGLRPATEEDVETVLFHAAAMHLEELQEDPLQINPLWYRQRILETIRKNRYFIWQEKACHYFQARISHLTDRVAQIEGVYTPKPYRKRGYAARGLSDLCDRWLKKVPCLSLFVNEENRQAVGLYEKLGFRYVMDFQSVFYENH